MKKAFTLVEMLIVVVVLVTLMTMTFRLSSIGSDQSRRNNTISRLQRIENCLSGYYAAFGSYPPVKLHGSRNISLQTNDHGIQTDEKREISWGWTYVNENDDERNDWQQVKAACRSQPVDCRFPFPDGGVYNQLVQSVSDAIKTASNEKTNLSSGRKNVLTAGFDDGITDNPGRHNKNRGSSDWRDVQLFKFGLMSYLLPRYLVMMNGKEELFEGGYAQWDENNVLPCNPMTGYAFHDWSVVRDRALSDTPRNYAEAANIPSQAVTARWLPNLEGIVCCNYDYQLYGISIRGDVGASELSPNNMEIEVFSPDEATANSTSQQYVLDSLTVLDGWWHEFYYYSPAPYQTYTLWSAGPNDRTFPPWISRKSLDSKANECISVWISDDIVRMSN